MTLDKQKSIVVTRSVDTRGTHSPSSLMEIKKTIEAMQSGEIIEILSADERTIRDIPKWCVKQGHEYIGAVDENGYFKVYLMKNNTERK